MHTSRLWERDSFASSSQTWVGGFVLQRRFVRGKGCVRIEGERRIARWSARGMDCVKKGRLRGGGAETSRGILYKTKVGAESSGREIFSSWRYAWIKCIFSEFYQLRLYHYMA